MISWTMSYVLMSHAIIFNTGANKSGRRLAYTKAELLGNYRVHQQDPLVVLNFWRKLTAHFLTISKGIKEHTFLTKAFIFLSSTRVQAWRRIESIACYWKACSLVPKGDFFLVLKREKGIYWQFKEVLFKTKHYFFNQHIVRSDIKKKVDTSFL